MKVKIVANELVDTDIEMVSLVRHGANRAPFKVLKSEDGDDKPTLGDKLQSFFSLKKDDFNVVAYFIRKDASDLLLPVLKSHGIDVDKATEMDGVVSIAVMPDVQARGFVQLNDALAVAVDQPIREFSDESIVKAYAEGLGLSDFAPGVSLAVNGLAGALWTLLNPADASVSKEDRVAKVDSLLASFRKYITSIAKALPDQVFRVEATTHDLIKEDSPMKVKLTEAVAGDLDGLTKAEAPASVEPKIEEPKAEDAAPVAKAEEAAPASEAPAAEQAPQDPILKALEALAAKVDNLAKSIDDQRTVTDNLSAKIVEAESLAKSATEKVASTTLLHKGEDIDLALSSLGGRDAPQARRVAKSGEAVWEGLMPDLDTFRPSR